MSPGFGKLKPKRDSRRYSALIIVRVYPEVSKRIDAIVLKSRSETIRMLLEKGLKQMEKQVREQ